VIYKSIRDVTDGMPKYVRAYGKPLYTGLSGVVSPSFMLDLKLLISLSQSLPQFRQLLGAADKEGDTENHEHVHGLKKTFKHS
jgi:hypothetical protein